MNFFRNIRVQFYQSLYFRRSLILISGTAASQVIALLFQLVLRRLFSPAIFGAFAIYLSAFSILAVLTSFKYETAIVIPAKRKDAVHLFYLSTALNLLFCILLSLVFLFFRNEIAKVMRMDVAYSHWLLILPLSLLFFGMHKIINFWLLREKKFRYASVNKVIRRSFEGSGQALTGLLGFNSGLVWGHLLGNLSHNISGWLQLKRTFFFAQSFDISTLKGVMNRFSNFPKFQAFPHLLNTLSLMLPVIIVNVLFSQEITGFFDLTRQVLALPLALVSTSLSQVVLQDVSEKRNRKMYIKSRIYRTFGALAVVSIPGVLVVLLWGRDLFSFVFGEEWGMSGKIAQILVFSYAIKFVVTPLSSVLTALEKLKMLALWRISYFAAIMALFLFKDLGILAFFKIYMAIEVFFYGIYLLLIWWVSRRYDHAVGLLKMKEDET